MPARKPAAMEQNDNTLAAQRLNLPGLLHDVEIADLCQGDTPMLAPFFSWKVREADDQKVVSYGLSSLGYDIRLDTEFLVPNKQGYFDPHYPNSMSYNRGVVMQNNGKPYVQIAPGSGILGRSVEWFNMPEDVLGICLGKSTYARNFILVNATPLEPGWKGYLTIALSNVGPAPARVYFNEGIAQVLFLRAIDKPANGYSGKYQGQTEVTTSKV